MDATNYRYTIYQQARSFWFAYQRCMIYMPKDEQSVLPIPAMANSAFSAELFLKAILEENGTPFDRHKGHSLDYLFGLLPFATRKAIMMDVDDTTFDLNLSRCSKIFETFRYLHEDIFKSEQIDLKFWELFINAIKNQAETTVSNKGNPVSIEL